MPNPTWNALPLGGPPTTLMGPPTPLSGGTVGMELGTDSRLNWNCVTEG